MYYESINKTNNNFFFFKDKNLGINEIPIGFFFFNKENIVMIVQQLIFTTQHNKICLC